MTLHLLNDVKKTRLRLSKITDAKHKAQFGQFLTPETTARFMASMFSLDGMPELSLLDPGAGIGSLSAAFLNRFWECSIDVNALSLTAYEIDDALHDELKQTLESYADNMCLDYEVRGEDFIESAINRIQFGNEKGFTHAILNPPYKKIASSSKYRKLLNDAGVETVNLYSAFVALTILLMQEKGQIVAIIPRSFCNGPYYKSFRELVLSRCVIRQIHLFASRGSAFKDDGVLQENVILSLVVGGVQGGVKISTSTDDKFDDLVLHEYPFDRIIQQDDKEKFIHIPFMEKMGVIGDIASFTLSEIGIGVSTGPVVDFRLKDFLRPMPEDATVPLLYPVHFSDTAIEWPKYGKKPNAIIRNAETEKWLYPAGYYCLVRRFSSKEERRRIIACVIQPTDFIDVAMFGFENHLNVFHEQRHGLCEYLAKGLSVYLNCSMVDEYFRQFSGHTQVNVTDLKRMKYPDREKLIALGRYAYKAGNDQNAIDRAVLEVCGK